MNVLLAINYPAIESIVEKLESKSGIRELEKSLNEEGLSQWAKPITIVDEAKYREAVIERARLTKPDVILLYDKLPGAIELNVLLEEIRLEIRNEVGKDTRVVLLTSLEEGATLLRTAVEIGIWDIISGKDITPIDIIRRIYEPCNYSDVAHFKIAAETKSQVKFVPRYIEKEKIIEIAVEKEVKVTEIVKEKEYIRVGKVKGIRETILVWSPYETGKTFVAVNLAVSLSHKGLKTVLIYILFLI
jgi:DNA-binding NarL/FixJ family response regulator